MGKIVHKSPAAKPKSFGGAKKITKKPYKPVEGGKRKFDKRGKQRTDK